MVDISTTKISDGQGQGGNILMISIHCTLPCIVRSEVDMREIQLVNGGIALVDEEDYEKVKGFKWRKIKIILKYYISAQTKVISGNWQIVYLHRFLMNCPAGMQVDHINGDTFDNRKQNLRICTRSQNHMNKTKHRNNKSGYKGLVPLGKKFIAQIRKEGQGQYLGLFKTPEEAALAYNWAAAVLFGEFAKLNPISQEDIHGCTDNRTEPICSAAY